MKKSEWAIDLENVRVRRGEKDALRGLTLKIGQREKVSIVGPNGSGKSTLIKTITRELYPTGGEARLYGKDVWDVFELRSRMGIVSYDVQSLFAQEITGRDVVLSGFFGSVGLWKNNRVTPAMIKKAQRAMRWIGIDSLQKRTMPHLSSGEARRFLIARALIHEPEIILFDEPMNSLDLGAQALVKQTLRRLAKAGVGLVLVTHHLSDIIPEITRTVLLKEGRVLADGPKNLILTEDRLRKTFGAPVGIIKKAGYIHAY